MDKAAYRDSLRNKVTTKARDSILAFTKYTKRDYEFNWHHRFLCNKLDQFANGKIKRLMVFMPPRHGKSELVSRRLPAFLLGKNPDSQLICTSYSADLASRMNRDVQRIIDSEEYQELFPDTRLNQSNVRTIAGQWMRNSDLFEIVGHRGAYRSSGVGGGITGMGAHYIVIDDPIKNQDEADSITWREKLWDWYTSTLSTRLEKNGSILITLTRWHDDDLAARLLNLAKKNPEADQWDIISFPAICENNLNTDDPREIGQPLWPNKYDNKALSSMRASMGSRVWSALYQQRPSPEDGIIFQRPWFKYYNEIPTDMEFTALSVDLPFDEGGSFAVFQVWGRKKGDRYLLDQTRGQVGFNEQRAMFKAMCAKWPHLNAKWVEKKANGAALISTLQREIPGIIPINPMGSKEQRAEAVAPQFESGNVFLPENAPWINDYVEELLIFNNGTFNDQVDATSQALMKLNEVHAYDWSPVSIKGASKWL